MRARALLIVGLTVVAVAGLALPAAASPTLVLAQEQGGDAGVGEEATQGGEEQGEGTGGQDESEAETGAGEGETEGATETGPVWTYQMARITLALLVLLLGAIGLLYWRLIARRRRRGLV